MMMEKSASRRMAWLWLLLLQVICSNCQQTNSTTTALDESKSLIHIDGVVPDRPTTDEDEYLCTSIPLPDKPMKLIGIEPLSEQETVHHMLLFGCNSPAQPEKVWNCKMKHTCADGEDVVLYGWGKNAPKTKMPADTGYSVGPGTGIKNAVLQVHFLKPRPAGDTSGVRLFLTETPVAHSAGLIAYASMFSIPPRQETVTVGNECCYSGFEPLSGFAFRVHTHALGESVFLESNGLHLIDPYEQNTTVVAEKDPQLPQGFYPIDGEFTIYPGDRLRATCVFNSTDMEMPVYAGHTSKDEMCNLYLMLYSDLPYFMWCVDNKSYITPGGAGGVPNDGVLVPEVKAWAPPSKLEVEGIEGIVQLGQISGLATPVNNDGTLWAFTRATRTWTASSFDSRGKFTKPTAITWPVVQQMDRDTGTVLRSWGANMFYMPHMITIDRDGNVWVVDTGAHQVLKYTPDGKLLMTLGQALSPGHDHSSFCQPTHAVIARDGTIFVADGYCNSRIMRFSNNGTFEKEYILRKAHEHGPEPLPHSLALDECRQLLWVADREAGRVMAITIESGANMGEWNSLPEPGYKPYGIRLGPYGNPIVLAWDRDRSDSVWIVALDGTMVDEVLGSWHAVDVRSPHDLEIMPAPVEVTGTSERLLSVVIAETAPIYSKMKKFVIMRTSDIGGKTVGNGVTGDSKLPAGAKASHIGHVMLHPAEGLSMEGDDDEDGNSNQHTEEEDNDSGEIAEDEDLKAKAVFAARTIKPSRFTSRSGEDGTDNSFYAATLLGIFAVCIGALLLRRTVIQRKKARGYHPVAPHMA